MISLRRRVRVYARPGATDLRKGFNGLSGLVREELGRDPLAGDYYVFTNRKRTTVKILSYDGTGLCLFQKRLEVGRFCPLTRRNDAGEIVLTSSELTLYLEGCQVVGFRALSPPEVEPEPLVRALVV